MVRIFLQQNAQRLIVFDEFSIPSTHHHLLMRTPLLYQQYELALRKILIARDVYIVRMALFLLRIARLLPVRSRSCLYGRSSSHGK